MCLLSAKRVRENLAVLFIDVDRFKMINDTLGHNVADALLVEIALRLRSCVRQTDTVARYGGDEFTIILPDLHQPEDAAQVAEKILERVIEPVAAGATAIDVSVSIGIAVYPYDGTDFDALLRNADDAMYRAKHAGRNCYQLCTEHMKTRPWSGCRCSPACGRPWTTTSWCSPISLRSRCAAAFFAAPKRRSAGTT